MSTTLSLFWDLSSASTTKRLQSSAALINTLEHFQTLHNEKSNGDDAASEGDASGDDESGEEVDAEDDAEDENDEDAKEGRRLDRQLAKGNSEDLRYAVRRLVRGLASPKESARLGFAVALTELISRFPNLTPQLLLSLLLRSSTATVSTKSQEARDFLFARLFGLSTLVQSRILYRADSSLEVFQQVVRELIRVGGEKSWLRESCWWAVLKAVEGLDETVSWRTQAAEWVTSDILFGLVDSEGEDAPKKREWTPEKVALTLRMQSIYPKLPWKSYLQAPFKSATILHPNNLPALARILKESGTNDVDEDLSKAGAGGSGTWKPQPHFVWDLILDLYFPSTSSTAAKLQDGSAAFSDFYRVAVDESLFDNKSSAERKYWGFQVFEKALPKLPAAEIPLVFTPNFMRAWMNNLAVDERYLHKAALSIAKRVQAVVQTNPSSGFAFISQLVGKNGNQNFDRLTKTKTVASLLASLDVKGVTEYVAYLKEVVYTSSAKEEFDLKRVEARRTWAFDQLYALVKNGAIPRGDAWISSVVNFFALHGLFNVKTPNKKSKIEHLHTAPNPALSDALHHICRQRLTSVLGALTSESSLIKDAEGKTRRVHGSDSHGTLWISHALSTIETLEKDTKHVTSVTDDAPELIAVRSRAATALQGLGKVPKEKKDAARGLELLIQSVILQSYDEPEESVDVLEELIGCAEKMFSKKASKKAPKKADDAEETEDLDPMDLLVDVLIGFMERSSAQLRALATQVFGMLSGEATESTIDLLLAQIEQRPVEADDEADDEDADMAELYDDYAAGEGGLSAEESSEDEDEDLDEEDATAEVDPELRRRIAEALQVNGAAAEPKEDEEEEDKEEEEDEDSEDELLMDDDQMLALDDKLAEIFKSQVQAKKGKKDAQREAVSFKTRILDLIETFIKKQPSSPLVLRLILPLLSLILNASPTTEAHLATKATGVLQNRLCSLKTALPLADRSEAVEILGELHVAARKAQSAAVAKTCSACSVLVARALLHDSSAASGSSTVAESREVLEAYEASLDDFMRRKATKIRVGLFTDLCSRFPVAAWGLRDSLIKYAREDGANAYRQTQAFAILTELISQIPTLSKAGLDASIMAFVPTCRMAIYTLFTAAASPDTAESKGLKADRLRDIVRFALKLARVTSPLLSAEERTAAWAPEELAELATKLRETERLKGSGGLHDMVRQLGGVVRGETKEGGKKRKAGEDETAAAPAPAAAVEDDEGAMEGVVAAEPVKKSEGALGEKKKKEKGKKALDAPRESEEPRKKKKKMTKA